MVTALSQLSKCARAFCLMLAFFSFCALGQTVIQKPGNYRNLPQSQIVPQALGSTLALTATSAYMGDGGYISAGSTSGGVTITITDGNGFKLANAWAISANQTVWMGQFSGAYLPGGFTITCSGGAGACAAAHVYMAWYLAN